MITEFTDITTDDTVGIYQASTPIFSGILKEVRELSRKKPEATMSASKVKIVNRVLQDLLTILEDEPSAKYLDLLDDKSLPQVSDAVLAMVQFETALEAFARRYRKYVNGGNFWITEELVEGWKAGVEFDPDDTDN